MRLALAEARRAWGQTYPNPAVGAIIVDEGEILAAGHTAPAGGPHAEVQALEAYRAMGLEPNPRTHLFVTLEPCSTHGRTPPCTDAILASGIQHVVIGATDPNPKHCGRGIALLRDAGLSVTEGVLAEDCADLNLMFNHWMLEGELFIAAKVALTLDGCLATRTGSSQWITQGAARQDVMHWRHYFPAVGVGAGTVLQDNPKLTVRLTDQPPLTPRRLIFDRHLRTLTPPWPEVYTDATAEQTILITDLKHGDAAVRLASEGRFTVWPLDLDTGGGWASVKRRCAEAGLHGLLIEGGGRLLSDALKHRALDYLFAYRAPKLFADKAAVRPFSGQQPGEVSAGIELDAVRLADFPPDQLMRGFVRYPKRVENGA